MLAMQQQMQMLTQVMLRPAEPKPVVPVASIQAAVKEALQPETTQGEGYAVTYCTADQALNMLK